MVPTRDPMLILADCRKSARVHPMYRDSHDRLLRAYCRPVLGQLRMIEAAIRMDLQMRSCLAAWRAAA